MLTTLAVLITYFVFVWVIQCVISSTERDASAKSLVYGILIAMIYFSQEISQHIWQGIMLQESLPEDERKYDSMFIHYMRIIILGIVIALFLFIVGGCFLICCMGYVYQQSR